MHTRKKERTRTKEQAEAVRMDAKKAPRQLKCHYGDSVSGGCDGVDGVYLCICLLYLRFEITIYNI